MLMNCVDDTQASLTFSLPSMTPSSTYASLRYWISQQSDSNASTPLLGYRSVWQGNHLESHRRNEGQGRQRRVVVRWHSVAKGERPVSREMNAEGGCIM
jgi:hypothetical protein